MEDKYLEQQIETLISLGYSKEIIIKMATIAPSMFRHSPEELKAIFNLISISKGELLSTPCADEEKNPKKR